MPKKGKKGKKAAAEEAARLEAEQKAKELEEKRKFEEELEAPEAALLLARNRSRSASRTPRPSRRILRSKLEGLDAEVTPTSAVGHRGRRSEEAATERRAKMREEEAAQREAVFREAETTMAVREVEVAAREAAMGENVMRWSCGSTRCDAQRPGHLAGPDDAAQEGDRQGARGSQIARAGAEDEVLKMEATLAQKERDARGRVEREERKLMQKDFTLKRRLARRVKGRRNCASASRAECDVRDRRLRVRRRRSGGGTRT